ncbi:MAG: MFS transporter [Pseudomonadota bacterium]
MSAEVAAHSAGPTRAYRSYVLTSLGIVAFFNFVDRSVFSVLAVSIKEDLSLSDTEIGLLGGFAFALFYACLGVPLARLADRSNRVRLVSICLALWSAATAACGLATGFLTLLLSRIGVGAGEAGCFPPSYSIISDYYPANRRAFAIGMFHAGGNVGFLVGLMAAGLLADAVGWRAAFFILGLPGVAFAGLFFATVREPLRGASPSPAATPLGLRDAIGLMRRRSAFVHLTIAYTLSILAFYSALAWLPHFFARTFGMDASAIGFWYGLAFGGGLIVGVMFGALVAPSLIKRNPRWEYVFPGIGSLIAMPSFLLIYWIGNADWALVFTAVGSAAVAMGLGPAFSAVQSLAEPSMRATAAAFVLLISAILGQGLGPVLVGVLSDTLAGSLGDLALATALSVSTAAFAWSAVHVYLGSRRFVQQVVTVPNTLPKDHVDGD